MSYVKQYYQSIEAILTRIVDEQEPTLEQAASLMEEAVNSGRSLYLFGASHAGIIAEDAFYRAGGLALFNPLFSPALMLNVEPVTLTSQLERIEGYGNIILDSKPVQAGDVVFIHSVSGRNPVAIDLAIEAKARGMHVISLTNLTYSMGVTSRHSSGKRLFEVSDIIIDNYGEPGDATVSIDSLSQKVAPTSTISGSFVIHSIVLKLIEKLEAKGKDVPIFRSANLDGGDDYNATMMARYKDQIHYM
ncbi:SIS domain-containing protein [Bacillus sp. Marseille-P3800]|uniref:SIS domain-containing protein n=1 Tax=Bacillus sp. Marseille-P3800 TaxID=2014782 RepID=UPI000C07D761|nr:SIS domain-containing protein [Bacillus sp. Marseille-P3800]